jgi:methionyl-tRNA formyltransferase
MKVLFWGSKQIGLRCFEILHGLAPEATTGIVTVDDRGDSRSVMDAFIETARDRSLPLVIAHPRTDPDQIMKTYSPDLCFVVGWYRLFKEQTLQAAPRGFIGIHNSLLPKYRGGAPLVWSIINNESAVGFTIFSMTKGMDDGPIWAQGSVTLDKADYVSDALRKIENRLTEMLGDLYPRILNGSATPVPQDLRSSTFCAQRLPDDGMIDWRKPADDIYSFIRAQSHPYSGAFTLLMDKKLIIWRARPDSTPFLGTPGQVAKTDKHEVCVICGDMKPLLLESVQVGAEPVDPRTVLRSLKIRFPSFRA